MIVVKDNCIVDSDTGEVYSQSITPKFQGWNYDKYRKQFKKDKSVRFLHPMKAEELLGDKLDDVLNNSITVAEKKWDGHRGTAQMSVEANRVFSRNISKESGWFSENSDQMPHIRDCVREELAGTVLDGEITLPIKNCTCRDVQGVTGALPETALKCQEERGFAILNAFDILYYKGLNVQHFPYWKRKLYLWKAVSILGVPFIRFCSIYCTSDVKDLLLKEWGKYDLLTNNELKSISNEVVEVASYRELYNSMIGQGDEGIILKNMYCEYEQKVSKDFVKMKGHNTYDCVIMGYEEPTKDFDGKTELDKWQYWYHPESDSCWEGINEFSNPDECSSIPVTKLYCKGWIGAIHFGVWKQIDKDKITKKDQEKLKDVADKYGEFAIMEDKYVYYYLEWVGRCAGLSDSIRDEISKHKDNYLGAVIEVEAQKIINNKTGSLQHPRFVQFRPDKDSEECTFEAHIRRYGED